MAEIALRTTERKIQKAKYFGWRPVGSTIVCCSDSLIRRKWLEICCDLVSPKKRYQYKAIPGWQKLCDAWTPALREEWFHYDRATKDHPIGRLLMDKSYPQVVWHNMIEPIGVLEDLPLAPDANVRVHDTWLWSAHERKSFFIVVNKDASSAEVESWQGSEARDRDTGEVLPELSTEEFSVKPPSGFYEAVFRDGGDQYWREIYDPAINLALIWKKQIRYQTDIGLSSGTLNDIANTDKVLNPRFDKPVESVKIIRPDLATVEVIA